MIKSRCCFLLFLCFLKRGFHLDIRSILWEFQMPADESSFREYWIFNDFSKQKSIWCKSHLDAAQQSFPQNQLPTSCIYHVKFVYWTLLYAIYEQTTWLCEMLYKQVKSFVIVLNEYRLLSVSQSIHFFPHLSFGFSFHCSNKNVTHILSLFTVTASCRWRHFHRQPNAFRSHYHQDNWIFNALEIIRIVSILCTTTVTVASWFHLNFSWPILSLSALSFHSRTSKWIQCTTVIRSSLFVRFIHLA